MRKNYVIVTGTIRSELYLRILLVKLCDLRFRGIIEKIIVSTWKGEVDKFSGLRKSLQELEIDLVESQYVDEKAESKFNKLGLVVQATTIRNAVKKVPNDCFIFKLRTDYNFLSKILVDFLINDKKSLAVYKYGDFPIAFTNKLVLKIWGWHHFFFVCDRFYYARKEDLLKICLPIQNEKCRDVQMQADNELLLSYTYHFYPLLRDIWDIIPLNFYDVLYGYCRSLKDEELNLPILLYRIYATMCVFVYTQVHLLDGDLKGNGSTVKLLDLFSERVRTNRQIESLVRGNIFETNAANRFKDELRKIALNLDECHTYTLEEYTELKLFAKQKLNINIKEYPFLDCKGKQGKLIDKEKSANLLLERYDDREVVDNIIARVDDRLDNFAVFFQENKHLLKNDSAFLEEMIRMGVYESDIASIEEYVSHLASNRFEFNDAIWVSCLRYIGILNHHSINVHKIMATYYALVKFSESFHIHGTIRNNGWRLLDSVRSLMNNLCPSMPVPQNMVSPQKFIQLLVVALDRVPKEDLAVEILKSLEIIHPHNNPFSEEVLDRLRNQGKIEFLGRISKAYDTPFNRSDWFITETLSHLLADGNLDSIMEYAKTTNDAIDVDVLLEYFWSVYWQRPSYQSRLFVIIESLVTKASKQNFIAKAWRFLATGSMSVSETDMAYQENFFILLETLYRKRKLRQNHQAVSEMCLESQGRHMFLQAFLRLEADNRLEFFSMKNGYELWLHFVPYLEHDDSKEFDVPVGANGKTWPLADRENTSAFAAYMRLLGSDVFISIEFSAKDIAKARALAKAVGYEEKNSPGSLIRLLTKRIPVAGENGIDRAVNEAMDEFCKVGEKVVAALDHIEV